MLWYTYCLLYTSQALELAKESSEKEDYGYEAEMNLLRRTIAENES